MTMPHLTNCPHSGDGWCLSCVAELESKRAKLQRQMDYTYCAYCGHEIKVGVGETASNREEAAVLIGIHITTCYKHPMTLVIAERDRLQAFKDWVHKYLDERGVPHHPPGVHGASGCRIGDRMDWLMNQIAGQKGQIS